MTTTTIIEIDGSTGEGGGQILRTSLALSVITGTPFVLDNIRAKRAKPGLMRQHLTCVNAAAAISGAQVEGAALNSQRLVFTPGKLQSGDYEFVIGSAGSCTLVLQTVWPALLFGEGTSRITIKGGTHNPMAPPFQFLDLSYAPLMRRLGAPVQLELKRHGFYPAGGGVIEAEISPAAATLAPFDLLERGALRESYAECLCAAIPRSVARRELEELRLQLGWQEDQMRQGEARQNEGPGNALMAMLAYENVCEVFTRLGEKGVSSEQVARSLAGEVRKFLAADSAVGPYLGDQWVLPLALAVWRTGRGASYTCSPLTQHARTNFEVIQRFLPVRITEQQLSAESRTHRVQVGRT
ncbi:RNA 3'-terminal phosphate cyclase [Diaphorobacter sp. HDW4A]|uniref:RNA 3'-terminal phosphate cyclase n=1 Tax=Diaphorobacter sp. HDW4A TaxID=2714924 RepID=UPI00140BA870|nr:RNA 3'-terminal phosphate cyclase [Diaphorobacter sp. HDW4A]QIL82502.1 RNA 3'-terminal phosphate cyclase [Diaphorobacter sp. HDW4A]